MIIQRIRPTVAKMNTINNLLNKYISDKPFYICRIINREMIQGTMLIVPSILIADSLLLERMYYIPLVGMFDTIKTTLQ